MNVRHIPDQAPRTITRPEANYGDSTAAAIAMADFLRRQRERYLAVDPQDFIDAQTLLASGTDPTLL